MARPAVAVVANGRLMGWLQSAGGPLGFRYDDDWLSWGGAYPLSVSLPLNSDTHTRTVAAWMKGLLPGNGE